ncbi:GNAT family N-acetyltransferase [Nonomuraea salmonea]|uniref:GNAT family N-acetyltransferase n=1 Tax=Nonomuraea salmonea TaxID=46181 RepID=UPI0031E64B20
MFDPDVRIATARLTLRPFGPADEPRIRSIVKSGVRFLPPGAPAKAGGVEQWLRQGVHELRRSGQGIHLAMTDGEGLIVGAISLFKTSWSTGTTEVGYGVHPLYRGRGFATEAVRGLAKWAFETVRAAPHRPDREPGQPRLAQRRPQSGLHLGGRRPRSRAGRRRHARPRRSRPAAHRQPGTRRHAAEGGPAHPAAPAAPPQEPRDAPHLAATGADPLTQEYTGVPRGYTEEHARAYIAHTERQRIRGIGVAWTAEELATGRYAVNLDLRDLDWHNRTAEVGYMTAPWARGNGYAAEAVLAVARWLFERHGFARLQLRAATANTASQRVAEKAGFVREGVARSSLAGEDLVVYSLIPSDLA